MRHHRSYAYFVTLLVLLLSLIFGCTASKKPIFEFNPLPPLQSTLPGLIAPKNPAGADFRDPHPEANDISSAADLYALSVANGNWSMARSMSTESNKLLLDQQIKSRLIAHWQQWEVKKPIRPLVDFETSLLVGEKFEDQIVLESIHYPTKNGSTKTLYLQFHISKIGANFLVSDSLLLTSAQIFPGE